MPETNKEQPKKDDQFCFQLEQVSVDTAQDEKSKRTFSGIAYSGEAITDHWYWEKVVFDLDSIQIKGRIPALLEHSTRQRAGAINSHSVSHTEGLKIEGSLLSNEFGTQVAQDSDDGFPWQMSVRIYPQTVEDVKEGSIVVNGRTFQAPIAVFRGGRIREVSFCALGADDNTNAVAASHTPKTNFNQEDTDVTELEQAKARITELEEKNTNLEKDIQKFKTDKREEDIKSLETVLNKQFSAEEKTSYTNMDDSSFAFMSQQMKQFAGGQPTPAPQQNNTVPPHLAHLFNHQATGDQNNAQQFNTGGQGTALDQAFGKFAAAQETK